MPGGTQSRSVYGAGDGWVLLDKTKLLANANTTRTLTWSGTWDMLKIEVWIPGYAGSDVGSLRFNGDTGANYWNRFDSNAAALATFTGADAGNSADTWFRLGTATNTQRKATVRIGNLATKSKLIDGTVQIGTGTTTVGTIHVGLAGEWNNAVSPITSLIMGTPGGVNMLAGTGIAAWGFSFS
jgi:hypothetical protein